VHPSLPTTLVPGEVPEALAAIDIGTNSVHMVVAQVVPNDRFEVLTRHKEMVRLGSGEGEMKELAPDAIDRGVDALRRCRTIAEGLGAHLYAVATSAVREARNATVFLHRARQEAGVEVNVISGVEEARLIQLGVLQALAVYDQRLLLVDVGGGSTEILYGQGNAVHYARSVKLGSLRMTRRFFPGGEADGEAVERCRRFVRARMAPVAHDAARLGFDVAVASSGTAETLAVMALARQGTETPSSLNGAVLTREALGAVIDELAAVATTDERRRLPGIDPARADILLGGALVLEQTCDALGVRELTISTAALREGVLLDALARVRGGALHHLSDLRRASVLHLLKAADDDPAHAVQVARLALELFDLVGGELELDDVDRELLEAAALLANVGLLISHSAHHKHSYYVIRNSEHLSGFTDAETELIAQVARYHRKSAPSEAKHPEFAALDDDDRRRVRAMAALLRVAIAMDRNHDAAVSEVVAQLDAGRLVLRMVPVEGSDLELERFSANERTGLLSQVLGRPVKVEAAAPES
jgi:exopolyphosphatase/guanosine-5'-triphosphate,3'-diphosphate pyrophosphatase